MHQLLTTHLSTCMKINIKLTSNPNVRPETLKKNGSNTSRHKNSQIFEEKTIAQEIALGWSNGISLNQKLLDNSKMKRQTANIM